MDGTKLVEYDRCEEVFASIRADGHKLVHCHGTFDLIHPGHVKHLAEAKALGDVLVVSITSAPYVNKGPGRPAFSDAQRAFQLAHLAVVDHVVIVPGPHAVEVIERIRPHIYCKGSEYSSPSNETDRRIDEDAEAVRRCGGEMRFVGAPLHSSTRLISQHLATLDPEVRDYVESSVAPNASEQIDAIMARIRDLRVLVVGDLIIDRYTYVHVQGLTAKAAVLSVRPYREETHLGGSLAIARHIASFGCQTRLLAMAGQEPWLDEHLDVGRDGPELELVRDADYQTIVKQRFVEKPGKRTDLIKHFAVNQLIDTPTPGMSRALVERLEAALGESDLVLLCDYGHGLVDERIRRLLEDKAPYLAINCQTNSYNYGFNLITQFRRGDMIALDENELCLAFGQRRAAHAGLLSRLAEELQVEHAWLTLGSAGSVVWSRDRDLHSCPAMVTTTLDTVGAGDAFLSVAALCSRVGADLSLASILANLAGASAANIVGNREPVRMEDIVKNARYLLKSRVVKDQAQAPRTAHPATPTPTA